MKSLCILALAVALALTMGSVVLADTGPGWDEPDWTLGVGIFLNHSPFEDLFQEDTDIAANYKTITNARVTGSLSDIVYEQVDQEVAVKIRTRANIPCYLELELVGNAGYTKGKSVGAGSQGVIDRTGENHWMLFDSAFGGFVGENWESIDTVTFSNIRPGGSLNPGVGVAYLQACDMWTANMFANIAYGFGVSATPLTSPAVPDELPLLMRYNLLNAWSGDFDISAAEALIGPFAALAETTVYMQFKVEYGLVPAGVYQGDVTFRMYSI